MIDSYVVLLITSITCSLLGVFLVLRKLSMVADAISHSVLLGIVISFFITNDINSPLLIIGAGVFGVLTVVFIEGLGKTKRVKRSDAIGVVFPMFFAIAVILISKFAKNVHIDTDVVLMGEVVFASLDVVNIFGYLIPLSAIKMGVVLIINLAFVLTFYRYLKVTCFDEEYAHLLGIPVGFVFYTFMTLTSITSVVAFDAVGSILVLSFFICPAACAYLISRDLKQMITWSMIFSIIICTIGSIVSVRYNISMAGMCASVGMIVFFILLFINKKGIVINYIKNKNTRFKVRKDMFVIHIGNHMFDGRKKYDENKIDEISEHFKWNIEEVKSVSKNLLAEGYVKEDEGLYILTEYGIARYKYLCSLYNLNEVV